MSKIRQIESANLKKTDKTISQALNDPFLGKETLLRPTFLSDTIVSYDNKQNQANGISQPQEN